MTDHEVGTIWRVGYIETEFALQYIDDKVFYQYFTNDHNLAVDLYNHYIIKHYRDFVIDVFYNDYLCEEQVEVQLEEFYNNPESYYCRLYPMIYSMKVFLEQVIIDDNPNIYNDIINSDKVEQYINSLTTEEDNTTIWRVGHIDTGISYSEGDDRTFYQYFTYNYEKALALYKHYIIRCYKNDVRESYDKGVLDEKIIKLIIKQFYDDPVPFYNNIGDYTHTKLFLEQVNLDNKPKNI